MPRASAADTLPPPPDIRSFASELAHEIRTPLAQIRLATESMLAGRIAADDDRESALLSIDREAERLGELTENLLLLLRAEVVGAYPIQRALDLGALLEDALASRAGPTLSLDPPSGLIVTGEPAALRLAFANLADEARDRAGGEPIAVHIRTDDECAVVAFRPIADADARSSESQPAGFRTVVAERIISAHGGTLEWHPGGGSVAKLPLIGATAR